MKFLIDAQLPPGICSALSDLGHDAIHVVERPGVGAADVEIVSLAEREGRIVMTKDADFLTYAQRGDCRCVRLLCGNTRNRAFKAWLEPRWAQIERELNAGAPVVQVI